MPINPDDPITQELRKKLLPELERMSEKWGDLRLGSIKNEVARDINKTKKPGIKPGEVT